MTIVAVLAILAKSAMAVKHLNVALPNIPCATLGGHYFWNTLAECSGWRVQQNMITQHCRILDDNNLRRAWGPKDAVFTIMDDIYKNKDRYL